MLCVWFTHSGAIVTIFLTALYTVAVFHRHFVVALRYQYSSYGEGPQNILFRLGMALFSCKTKSKTHPNNCYTILKWKFFIYINKCVIYLVKIHVILSSKALFQL